MFKQDKINEGLHHTTIKLYVRRMGVYRYTGGWNIKEIHMTS